MDMHEASDEAFETLSFSNLEIYSDPSSSSEEEQDIGNSFSSFRFKIAGYLPPKEIAFFGKLISVPEKELKPHRHSSKSSSLPRRKSERGFLMFGLGGSAKTMELRDLRTRKAYGRLPRIVPVNGGGGEEQTVAHRRSGNWSRKFFGACIPSF